MRYSKIVIFLALSLVLIGCATGSIRMVDGSSSYKTGTCEVEVFQTKSSAIKSGLQKEVCVVEGSSAFSFDHSIEGAVKNNIKKICSCGVRKAYIESAHRESQMGIKGVSYVNLVGFK
ncbi:hypothetical protein G8764_22070 [Pseudomaricurvus alcaniphilus]|uniref:hypothetical protein n=1 Tax=Pseudomaricurvus alcaniphilus TaxID=1166482 RepID=UPI0014098E7B|nr:hypothetical protein [Pseudomaricurvus alcaniphilus]NHN39993.1 hypothetical protein [Pseudomaricurvus alcaniphilus]